MKYLMSERLLAEDAEKFMREHEGCELVDEYPMWRLAGEAAMDVIKKLIDRGISLDENVLFNGIAESIIANIDAIVCYPEDENAYRRLGKKIITVENSEE